MDILSRFQRNKPPLCALTALTNTMSLFVLSLISPIWKRERQRQAGKQEEGQGMKNGGYRNERKKKSWVQSYVYLEWDGQIVGSNQSKGDGGAVEIQNERVKNGGLISSLTKRDSVSETIKQTSSSTRFPVLYPPPPLNSQKESIIWPPAAGISLSLHSAVPFYIIQIKTTNQAV